MRVDPLSLGLRYTLAQAGMWLQSRQPTRLRIASQSGDWALATVPYLPCDGATICVDTRPIQAMLAAQGVQAELSDPTQPADAAIFPFSLEEGVRTAGERSIVATCYNALSYRTLLHPRQTRGTIFGKISELRPMYAVEPIASLFSPSFIAWLTVAKAIEPLSSKGYFVVEDAAMRRLVTRGPAWRVSYVVVLAGNRAA
jgi:hypothetical protein